MPIWFELLTLLLVTYAVGLGIGWAIWGRAADFGLDNEEEQTE